ncbi:MAG: FUSC family protein [Gammaproteobacteria bacterium]
MSLLRRNLTLQSEYFRYALRLMISSSITVLLYELLQLKNGYWAAFSVIACVWPTVGNSLQRSRQRIVGTFMGMCLAIIIAHSFGYSQIAIDILLPIFIFLTFYLKPFNYGFFVLFTTVITVLFICLMVPGDWQMAITRLIMTLFGTLIALIATRFILPSRTSQTLPCKFSTVKNSIREYYTLLCQSYLNPKNASFHAEQTQVFNGLQAAFEALKESQQEYFIFSKHCTAQAKLYALLEVFYQRLLILEIHLPQCITQPELKPIADELRAIMITILSLFDHFTSAEAIAIRNQLMGLLKKIKAHRIEAAKNLAIASASLKEPIQLTSFVENLIVFVSLFKRLTP